MTSFNQGSHDQYATESRVLQEAPNSSASDITPLRLPRRGCNAIGDKKSKEGWSYQQKRIEAERRVQSPDAGEPAAEDHPTMNDADPAPRTQP
jgi:hypothetical protein